MVNPAASTTPIFNERFATYLFAIAVCAFVAWLASRQGVEPGRDLSVAWREIAIAAGLAVNVLILLAVGWEIHAYWWFLRYGGDWKLVHDWSLVHDYRMYAQFTYSAFFMLFGAVLLTLGFWRQGSVSALAGAGAAGGFDRQGFHRRRERVEPGIPDSELPGTRRVAVGGELRVSAGLAESAQGGK